MPLPHSHDPLKDGALSPQSGLRLPRRAGLTVIMPCYNEEKTLGTGLDRVMAIAGGDLELEILIVDDSSSDGSRAIAEAYASRHPGIRLLSHERNQGKGAALHTGFRAATREFVAVQDADLEYDPMDLRKLLVPLAAGDADVVVGSRFVGEGARRVLYFWHSLGNRFLTLLSNMLTDLNLTDMESCYKVFRREVIQGLDLKEKRFGFEPEVVAKIAQQRLRIYEIGVGYRGRTYAEGKKINWKDGVRALYCILKYNLPKVPAPVQFLFYLLIGGFCALLNLAAFLGLLRSGVPPFSSALLAFAAAAVVNYLLSTALLFRSQARWRRGTEIALYAALVGLIGLADSAATRGMIVAGLAPVAAKLIATAVGLALNFLGRRNLVFYEKPNADWKPQERHS